MKFDTVYFIETFLCFCLKIQLKKKPKIPKGKLILSSLKQAIYKIKYKYKLYYILNYILINECKSTF